MCRVECAVSQSDALTEGVWGQEQWVRGDFPVVPIATKKNKRRPPAGRRAEPYILFPDRDRAQRSERDPMPVLFPFPIPWTKSVGVFLFVLPRFSCAAYAFTFPHMSSMR